ncbi:inositol monophosphatase family protein [Umezawaea sp. Da 62-37]|uniref:inositol monophosphatase family protein n=1 Tax=Umezawaea sp. Da 62-37 TaxID=3075927 RepID=UPI0028F6FF28|nr:inositol monophosphatase family protein [Umezawaea sp. Da 62-37]WNV83169.1 inositol monophosphatase family protein [Umezawaea sp. Da 62-37]
MTHNIEKLRAFAEDLVSAGAAHAMGLWARAASTDIRPTGSTMGSSTDYATATNRKSDEAIRTRVAIMRPDDTVFSEQESDRQPKPGQVQWVADPISGTTNFRYGIPIVAVSVAARVDGVTLAGAVAEPATGRLWSGGLGEGARLHDPRVSDGWLDIHASSTREISQVLLATGFSDNARQRTAQAAVLGRVIGQINDVRRIGSAALDLCWVAAGAVDAFVEHHLNLWDWAAGALIAEEAGAVVHPPGTAGPAARLGDPVFAAAPGIATDLVDLLAASGAKSLRADHDELVRSLPSGRPPRNA